MPRLNAQMTVSTREDFYGAGCSPSVWLISAYSFHRPLAVASYADSRHASATEVFICEGRKCGCKKRFSTQTSLQIHINRVCWLCDKKLPSRRDMTIHEDSHLGPSTPSNPTKDIRGVRCLGCYHRFTAHTRAGDWQRHIELGRCPKDRMEDSSANITCVASKQWEAENLKGSRGEASPGSSRSRSNIVDTGLSLANSEQLANLPGTDVDGR
jgi:hypothetical protein